MTTGGSRAHLKPGTLSRFRKKRGRQLARFIRKLSDKKGRPICILDVGGRADYWQNVGLAGVESICIMNLDAGEIPEDNALDPESVFSYRIGDARNLDGFADDAIDLMHSNSVIEHVGQWRDMAAMASEIQRVGRAGWMQTPAWEFPVEPHFKVPFMHWFAAPLQRKMLWFSRHYRRQSLSQRRAHVGRINLLTHAEVTTLFPRTTITVERFMLLPKSYIAQWDRA